MRKLRWKIHCKDNGGEVLQQIVQCKELQEQYQEDKDRPQPDRDIKAKDRAKYRSS